MDKPHIHLPLPIKKGGPISRKHSRLPLIIIGIGKLAKCLGLIMLAFVLSRLLNPSQHAYLVDLLNQWRLDPHSHHLEWALEKVLAIPSSQLRLFRVGAIVYSALFGIEGIGLILDYGWAEWMLVITTGLLIPVEMWEVWERFTFLRVTVFFVNVAVMIYVCFRLKWRLQDKHLASGFPVGEPSPGPSA